MNYKFFLLAVEIFFLFVGVSYSRAQTFSSIKIPTTQNLYGVNFASDNIGYVCGDNSTIAKTVDGGKHWALLDSHTSEFLWDIKVIPGSLGQQVLVAGSNNTILKSYDGGATWGSQSVPLQAAGFITGLQCIDSLNFYACGKEGGTDNGVILRTTNGGLLWSKIIVPGTVNLNKVMVVNSTAYAVGTDADTRRGSITKSDDGGASWSSVKSTPNVINDLWCINSSKVIAVGAAGTIWQTSNAGATWTNSSVDSNDIAGVCFIDSLTGYTCGKKIFKTTDGGVTWSPVSFSLGGGTLSSISIPSSTTIYMAGSGGTVIKAGPIRVCRGDSVVLVLQRKYKEGSMVWQQSSDHITWSAAQGTLYNDSLVVTATSTYYYRAKVSTCDDVYSDTALVTLPPVPAPPSVNSASELTPTSFTASWKLSEDAAAYYLDVATDAAFTSFVPGYNNLSVGFVPSYTVQYLSCNTAHYYRVRASNSCGELSNNSNTIILTTSPCPPSCTYASTCSGNITDARDNQTYKTVQIGTQCWMAQNLNVGKRIDGILVQTPGASNQDTSIEKYCYDDNPANCNTHGGLYLWNEMMAYGLAVTAAPGPQGICPASWHLPTDNEWKCLEEALGGSTTAGGKLKDTVLWTSPNKGATNSSGFSARAGGYRYYSSPIHLTFLSVGDRAYFWSTTEEDAANAWYRNIFNTDVQIFRGGSTGRDSNKGRYGLSVRCVKN